MRLDSIHEIVISIRPEYGKLVTAVKLSNFDAISSLIEVGRILRLCSIFGSIRMMKAGWFLGPKFPHKQVGYRIYFFE